MILVIDNYDSFVYNIARYFECAGEVCAVVRNDAVTVEQARSMNPLAIVISPGPCTPKEAGVSVLTEHGMEMISNFVSIARAFQKNGAMAA